MKLRLLLLTFVLLAGCASPTERSGGGGDLPFQALRYEIVQDERVVGALTWTALGDHATFVDPDGVLRRVLRIGVEIDAEGLESVRSQFLLDPAGLRDVAVVDGCGHAPMTSCEVASVEWNLARVPLAWFGAGVLAELQTSADTAEWMDGESSYSFNLTDEGDSIFRLRPKARAQDARVASGLCNVLDDDTRVDLEARVVLECRPRYSPSTLFRLVGPPGDRLAQLPASELAGDPIAIALRPRIDPLPPGAGFVSEVGALSLREAHDKAVKASGGLSAFLERHPEAGIEEAAHRGKVSSERGNGQTKEDAESVLLRYVASRGAGYEILITRIVSTVGGVELSRAYTLERDAAWTPPENHRWPLMDPPAQEMAPMDATIRAIGLRMPSWNAIGIALHNDAKAEEGRPVYRYYVTLQGQGCRSASDCVGGDFVAVDAATGALAAARLSGENLKELFP